ncbi:MAG TPA: 1,4-alpha-glucan branching protein domain-containing protein, partial [Pyrinomonadaceae bacterium]|nr:1,4-alpha-glucan branching protein domain-containing protein [Pyrinomonadaceae bacterium]
TGYFSLILHAHLPFVRHPEHPEFLEEDWLYEAITEVYLPLIFAFSNLHQSGARPRLAMNVSPPLCEMLSDPLLQERYTRHLENLLALTLKEVERTSHEAPEFLPVTRMYSESLGAALSLWNDRYERNLVRAFRELQDEGVLEIITCGATHGFLPLISTGEAKRAQVQVAVANYQKHFNRRPRGIWLPECAYEPGTEHLLADAGIEYFISDTHAILYGDPRPRYGVYAPVRCPNGVAVFARDLETSQQVWSSVIGYPGHPSYREFYRDLGWDAPLDYLLPHLHATGERRHLGLKYHRITGRDVAQDRKLPYEPAAARERAAQDAGHFVWERIKQARHLRKMFEGRAPLVVSPYDAELFGHWWYEGPQFIDFVFRKLHWDQGEIESIAPGDYLDAGVHIQTQRPSQSSWGEEGYFKVWLNERNAWMYPHQHAAEERMTALANRFAEADPLTRRALNQAARELLLAESSDWAFQIYQGTTVEYATRRFRSHVRRFNALADEIEEGRLDEERLSEIESRDNIFPELDYRIYRSG